MPDTEIEGLKNPTGKDVLYSTYANIGKTRYASVNGYINWNATPRTRIYMNMSGNYSYLEGSEGMRNDGWSLFAYGGAQQTLPHDWRISLNVFGHMVDRLEHGGEEPAREQQVGTDEDDGPENDDKVPAHFAVVPREPEAAAQQEEIHREIHAEQDHEHTVVVLGKTGKNFAAGMSGGIAYGLDEDWDFYTRVNKDMVSLEPVEHKYDVSLLKDLIREHVEATGSPRGKEILDNFGEYLPKFKKVLPHDYDKMLRLIA